MGWVAQREDLQQRAPVQTYFISSSFLTSCLLSPLFLSLQPKGELSHEQGYQKHW